MILLLLLMVTSVAAEDIVVQRAVRKDCQVVISITVSVTS